VSGRLVLSYPDIDPVCLLISRNFDYKEKEEVDKYYPQFYHKTDKVRVLLVVSFPFFTSSFLFLFLGRTSDIHRTLWSTRYQQTLQMYNPRTSTPTSRLGIRKIHLNSSTRMFCFRRSPRRNLLYDSRPPWCYPSSLLERERFRDERF
jgi:hypothetical protein